MTLPDDTKVNDASCASEAVRGARGCARTHRIIYNGVFRRIDEIDLLMARLHFM